VLGSNDTPPPATPGSPNRKPDELTKVVRSAPSRPAGFLRGSLREHVTLGGPCPQQPIEKKTNFAKAL
jgi:hypothetical protein